MNRTTINGAPMTPDERRAAFLRQLQESEKRDNETRAVAFAHFNTFANRMAKAAEAMRLGNFASARSILELARLEYDALVQSLPEL